MRRRCCVQSADSATDKSCFLVTCKKRRGSLNYTLGMPVRGKSLNEGIHVNIFSSQWLLKWIHCKIIQVMHRNAIRNMVYFTTAAMGF